MENVSAYLPEINNNTLEEFFQAYDEGILTAYISGFIEHKAEDIEGATKEQIEVDKVNFEHFIKAEYNDCWEEREAVLRDVAEYESLI